MDREPTWYSRVLVFLGLLPLLFIDLFVTLPDGVFAAAGAVIITAAALVHFFGGERRAGAGWVLFGGALLFVSRVDVVGNVSSLIVFAILLLIGFALLVSQRAELFDGG